MKKEKLCIYAEKDFKKGDILLEIKLTENISFERVKSDEIKMTYKQIAQEIDRTEAGIKAMKKQNPRILDLIKKGLKYEHEKNKYLV
jgi:hypothetical protein